MWQSEAKTTLTKEQFHYLPAPVFLKKLDIVVSNMFFNMFLLIEPLWKTWFLASMLAELILQFGFIQEKKLE